MKNWLDSLRRQKKKLINISLICLVALTAIIVPMVLGIKFLIILNNKIEVNQDLGEDDEGDGKVNILKHLTNNYLGIINSLDGPTITKELKQLNPQLKIDQIKVKNITYTCCTIYSISDSYYAEFEKLVHYQYKNQLPEKPPNDFLKKVSTIKFSKIENFRLIDFNSNSQVVINQNYFKAITFKKILKMKPQYKNPNIIFSFDLVDKTYYARAEFVGFQRHYWNFKLVNYMQ